MTVLQGWVYYVVVPGCCGHVGAVLASHADGLGLGGVCYGGALFQSAPSPWAVVILLSLCVTREAQCHAVEMAAKLYVGSIVALGQCAHNECKTLANNKHASLQA